MFSLKNKFINQQIIAQHLNELGLLLDNVHNLVIDSRKVKSGDIFCAYPGTLSDGRLFINAAINNGATAIFFEPPYPEIEINSYPVPYLMQLVGILAAYKYKYPSKNLTNFAVTGTNGKTSISHWLNQAYSFLGRRTAIIGTTGAGVYPIISDYASTTPDPITLQKLIAGFNDNGVEILAMEVSSHALDQGRVNGVDFNTAIFTNLTQDHLDYHKTMENYFLAKQQLFFWDRLANAVINADDSYGARLINQMKDQGSNAKVITYGINTGEVRAKCIELSNQGCQFVLCFNNKEVLIKTRVIGRFNIYNLLAVIATLLVNNVNLDELPAIISQLRPVTGRMDATIIPDKPLVVVDYAHTPDALEKALVTLNEVKRDGKLICVFGCGGDRDKSKRPLMGKAVASLADFSIVTSDNPRSEEPMAIINDILPAMNDHAHYTIEVDRRQAISMAINQASVNDVILIAGKGHENYQEIKGIKYPFSDLALVRELLN